MKKLQSTAAVLLGAAEYLRDRGWCQGTMADINGRVCLLGALAQSSIGVDRSVREDAEFTVACQLGFDSATPFWKITRWNDERGRTRDEVIAVLERAAGVV